MMTAIGNTTKTKTSITFSKEFIQSKKRKTYGFDKELDLNGMFA